MSYPVARIPPSRWEARVLPAMPPSGGRGQPSRHLGEAVGREAVRSGAVATPAPAETSRTRPAGLQAGMPGRPSTAFLAQAVAQSGPGELPPRRTAADDAYRRAAGLRVVILGSHVPLDLRV